jgi:hypothetical protein
MGFVYFSFQGFSKLLICGGHVTNTCEVIDLESPATICKNQPNFPVTIFGGIGGLGFKENPIICGGNQNGDYSNKCYYLENNQWLSYLNMRSVRYFAAAAQLQDGKLFVTGGYNNTTMSNSAEILFEDGRESNIPSLPVGFAEHCMVAVNSTTVMLIGGFSQVSGHTFYLTFGGKSWTEGPELKFKRYLHSCGRIRSGKESQQMSIIVAGGYDYPSYLSSVEILDEGSSEWKTGPELPFGMRLSQMVEDHSGGVILIGGELSPVVSLDILYRLPHAGQDALWTEMEQKLASGRKEHTAFLVPDQTVDCL